MKSALIAVALAATLSIPAFAQDTTQPPAGGSMPATGDPSMQAPATDTTQPPASAPDASMPQGTTTTPAPDSSMPMTPGATSSSTTPPDSSAAMPAGSSTSMPAGAMAPAPGGMAMSNAPAAGDPSTYPVCSKTVTDRCINRASKHMKKRG